MTTVPEKITRDEFEQRYGDVKLSFWSYYKYTFTFRGTAPDGAVIEAGYGGESGEIYRTTIAHDETRLATLTDPWWYTLTVTKDEVKVFEHYEFP